MKLIGILLIAFGVFGLMFGGFDYVRRDKLIDTDHIQVSTQRKESVPITPIAGGLVLLFGVALVLGSKRQKS